LVGADEAGGVDCLAREAAQSVFGEVARRERCLRAVAENPQREAAADRLFQFCDLDTACFGTEAI